MAEMAWTSPSTGTPAPSRPLEQVARRLSQSPSLETATMGMPTRSASPLSFSGTTCSRTSTLLAGVTMTFTGAWIMEVSSEPIPVPAFWFSPSFALTVGGRAQRYT
jgi:hypothetical protein